MKKSDLKSGMIVEYRNGDKRLVVNDDLIGTSGSGVSDVLSDYDDDLKCVGYDVLDIMKVYKYKVARNFSELLADYNLELIWERKEIKLSVKEIEILKALKTLGFEFLARDEDGALYAYSETPYKDDYSWDFVSGGVYQSIGVYSNLFDFIKWKDEEPVNIDELLKD